MELPFQDADPAAQNDAGGELYAAATMGMHHGVIAATATQRALLAELERHAGEFVLGERMTSPSDLHIEADDDGFVLAVGERDGRAFLVDSSFALSTADDMLVDISRRLGLVVGCGAETVSGSYWFTAAQEGHLGRCVWFSHSALSSGGEIGDALPTEADHPIDELNGDGLFAALALLNLDALTWMEDGTWFSLRYTASRYPAKDGWIAGIKAQHRKEFLIPEDERPKPTVVVRRVRQE